jgi:hypothetical protein
MVVHQRVPRWSHVRIERRREVDVRHVLRCRVTKRTWLRGHGGSDGQRVEGRTTIAAGESSHVEVSHVQIASVLLEREVLVPFSLSSY